MSNEKIKWLERLIAVLFIIGFIAIVLLCNSGCIAVPLPLEEAVHEIHKGGILVCDDYSMLVISNYEGEERDDKLRIIEKYLKMSKELDKYVEGRGGKIGWPWK